MRAIVAVCAACLLAACSAPKEMEKDSVPLWSESDTKAVVDSMAEDMLQSQWLRRWTTEHEGQPTVIVGPIENETMQHIDEEETVIQHISRKLTNAGTVQVAPEIGQEIRHDEMRFGTRCPGGSSTSESVVEVVKLAQEKGADFVVHSTIRSTVEEGKEEDEAVLIYTVNLELLNTEKNEKAWLQDEKIRKVFDQGIDLSPRSPKGGNRMERGMPQGC